MAPSPSTPSRLRSLYRSFIREIPSRPLSSPSSLQKQIRLSLQSSSSSSSSSSSTAPALSHLQPQPQAPKSTTHTQSPGSEEEMLAAASQALEYLAAQRRYVALLERYNPGLGSEMEEEERVRLSARRVGMEIPGAEGWARGKKG